MLIVQTADGSATAHSDRYQETYHSIHGAATESRHVFLDASGVRQRLSAGYPTRVLEIGFGLGLNYLLSADLAIQCQTTLEYHAFEHDLLSPQDFKSLNYDSLVNDQGLVSHVAQNLLPRSDNASLLNTSYKCVQTTLHACDVTNADLPAGTFNAIYFDAFSPDTNPDCWNTTLFATLRAKLETGGVLSTYCSKGSVRRGLQSVGFNVKKMAGPPGKREIVVAVAP